MAFEFDSSRLRYQIPEMREAVPHAAACAQLVQGGVRSTEQKSSSRQKALSLLRGGIRAANAAGARQRLHLFRS
jgi:hypothetical protein